MVSIATYGYFALCLIARQPYLDAESKSKGITLHAPIFTTLQLVFYMGWLKVGQYLTSPFGEDDDDFGESPSTLLKCLLVHFNDL